MVPDAEGCPVGIFVERDVVRLYAEGDPPFPILDFGCGPGRDRGRYGVYHDLESWRRYLSAAGFVELTHYYRPTGLPRAQQPWLASGWRNCRKKVPR